MNFNYPNIVRSILLEAAPKNKKPYDPNEDEDDTTDYNTMSDVTMTDDTVDTDIDDALDNALSDNPSNPETLGDETDPEEDLDNALEDDPENPQDDGDIMDQDMGADENELDKQINNDDNTDTKKYNLLKDFLALHETLKTSITTINDSNSIDSNKLVIYRKVIDNLTILKDYLYRYVMYNFDRNSYVKNLTMYNYFVAGLSLNVNLLKEANEIIEIV